MYESFYHLQSRPFLAAPQANRYFPASVIENARQTLDRCIERGEGAGLIVGPTGTGKTLLCQVLAVEFKDRFQVALLTSGRLATRRALLQAILFELKLPYRGMDEGELRLFLLDHLEPAALEQNQQGLLLIVDEAHTLPWRLLEEIRLISNFVRDGQPRVRVILAGSPVLEERFASPKLASFSQRLAARCYLESFTRDETAAFIRAQIAAVGGNPQEVFHDDALQSVFRATDGIARLINQVCDHALILASLGGLSPLTSDAIEEAWADLQQLPTPFRSTSADENSSNRQVIEFGGLDDLPDDPLDEMPEAIPFRAAPTRPLQVASPDEQLDAIEDHLEQINVNFQRLHSEGTEVELDFPEFGNPFGEKFSEEEIVFDRYSNDVEVFADLQRVSSREGRQLGSLLSPHDTASQLETPRAKIKIMSASNTQDLAGQNSLNPPAANPAGILPGVSLATTEEGWQESIRDNDLRQTPQTLSQVFPSSLPEPDLIVVEDSPAKPPMPSVFLPTSPPQRVRKMEYRQLFTKLRRG